MNAIKFLIVGLVVSASIASAQECVPGSGDPPFPECYPNCIPGADPNLPRHFTFTDARLVVGGFGIVEVHLEKYEPAQVINLIAWDRANEYTVVGITPGADLPSWWNFDIDYNFNNEPGRHRIRLDNWRLPDFCLDGITGDAREYRENCTRERFHIANIILEGLSSGVTTLDIDRSCSSQFQVETSWMSYYVESNCGQSGARHCLTDPNDPWHGGSVVYVTANNRFLVDPLDVLLTANAVVEVDGPSDALPVSEYTWSLIKSLYK